MRVLMISHDFLPAHPAGTEIYTAQLAARLQQRGIEVELFTTEKDISAPHLSLRQREHGGLRVHELINNLFYDEFSETYDWDGPMAAFRGLLDRFRPQVIHVMHLLYLSIGCVEEARRRGIPVVYTLHDFWLQCARFGQRIHADGEICHSIDFERCGSCLAQFKFSQSKLERRSARIVAAAKRLTGINLEAPLRRAASLLRAQKPGVSQHPGAAAEQHMAQAAAQREQIILARLVPAVERFFAPSAFLRERFLEWGIAAERIYHVPNGIELERPPDGGQRQPGQPLRVAFLGTLAAHKAPHLLLDAWAELAPEQRAGARLTLYGPGQQSTEYVSKLRARAEGLGVPMPGALARDAVPQLWRELDLLVIPSIWYENAPLTILEARAASTAVLVSDLGGMAEMVQEGVTGWRFPVGDAHALAQKLAELIRDPGRLDSLKFDPHGVKSMDTCAMEMLGHYTAVIGESP